MADTVLCAANAHASADREHLALLRNRFASPVVQLLSRQLASGIDLTQLFRDPVHDPAGRIGVDSMAVTSMLHDSSMCAYVSNEYLIVGGVLR